MFDRAVQLYYSSIILNIYQNGWNGHQQLFELGHYIWDTSALGWNPVLCWTERSNLYLNFRHLMEFLDETLCYVGQSAPTLAAHYIWVLGWNFTLDRVLLIDFLDETRSYVGNSVLRWAECSNLPKATALAAPGLYCYVTEVLSSTDIIIMKLHSDQLINNLLRIVWLSRSDLLDKGCAVRFVDYIARFSTYIVNLSTIIGEISQDNPQISSPQTWTRFFFSSFLISNWRELKIDRR